MLNKNQILKIKKQFQSELMRKKNVIGVGIGYKTTRGKVTDQLSLISLVQTKVTSGKLAEADLIPDEIQGAVTDVVQVGKIVAYPARTDRWRPAPPGVSIGHYQITAGTFGAVVRDVSTGKRLILSNNHVLANSNAGSNGDPILQPGPADGGRDPQDRIATLDRFVTIRMDGEPDNDDPTCSIVRFITSFLNTLAKMFGSSHRVQAKRITAATSNLVDAAVAKLVNDSAILNEIIDIGKVNKIREAELNLEVTKSGRTTGTTTGHITTLNAMIQVSYGNDQVATFEDQILTTNMSEPGDSGSLLVSKADQAAVGLLFAGSDSVTVHSPIQFVMNALNIDFNI
jgi:hypothetical protein